MRAHIGEDIEVPVAKGVVEQHAVPLRQCTGLADDVDDRDVFRVCSGYGVDSRELTDSEGGYEG